MLSGQGHPRGREDAPVLVILEGEELRWETALCSERFGRTSWQRDNASPRAGGLIRGRWQRSLSLLLCPRLEVAS